jgi:hypothetical protein
MKVDILPEQIFDIVLLDGRVFKFKLEKIILIKRNDGKSCISFLNFNFDKIPEELWT